MPKFRVTRVESVTVEADDEQEARAVADERFDLGGIGVISDTSVDELMSS